MLKLCLFTIFCEKMDVIVSLWCEVTWPSRPYWFELAGQETWSKPCLPCPLWYFGLLTLLIYFIIFPTKFWHRDEDSVTLQQGALEELSQHILSAHKDSASVSSVSFVCKGIRMVTLNAQKARIMKHVQSFCRCVLRALFQIKLLRHFLLSF